MEATEVNVYGFIYKLRCSESQRICEQMITRMKRKRATFFIMAFNGAMAASSVRRCVDAEPELQRWDREEGDSRHRGIVTKVVLE